ncbi:MAG TPA: hypothetical protein VLG37_03910 [Candidatus Saccharimonadales bacterium]|nr:hypothetical protein [Candidatus Saccharimonadales bacterium]
MRLAIKQQAGVTSIVLVIVLVLIIGGAGVLGWQRVKKPKPAATTSAPKQSIVNPEAQATCRQLYPDSDFCKFAGSWDASLNSYKVSLKSNFPTTTFDLKVLHDSNGNFSFTGTRDGTNQLPTMVYFDGDYYIKQPSDTAWKEYPHDKTAILDREFNPTLQFKVDFKSQADKPTAERLIIKNLGKEKCGELTCFKYQLTDPSSKPKEFIEAFFWFDDQDYFLRKYSSKVTGGSSREAEFFATSELVTQPTPVKPSP